MTQTYTQKAWSLSDLGSASDGDDIKVAFDDLDAIEQYGCTVVNEHSYPLMGRMGQPYAMRPPTIHDLYWLEGSLPALVTFFRQHLTVEDGNEVRQFEHTYLVETLSGSVSVFLKAPVFP